MIQLRGNDALSLAEVEVMGFTLDSSEEGGDVSSAVVSGGTEVVLSWTTVSGDPYGVMATTNLADGPWVSITNGVSGNGAPVSVTNAVTAEQRFFRVYREE
jgi:hypothetical protein